MTEVVSEAVEVLVGLSRAATTRAIYPRHHPAVEEAVDELLVQLAVCLDRRGAEDVTYLVIDHDVVLDGKPLRTKSMYLRPFVRLVSRLGIQRLTLARGVDQEELHELLSALSSTEGVESTPHVIIGRVQMGAAEDSGEGGVGLDADLGSLGISEEDVDRGAAAFVSLDIDQGGSVEELDRLVWRVIEGLAGSSRSLLLLAPVKAYDEYLFLHSINVSILAVAQARSLGIGGQMLHEIGLAAMLHDVGKMSLPKQLWDSPGRLDGRQWEIAKLHPQMGAAMLCASPNVPALAVLVAYEHHLRWDGKPSYPECNRLPNFASQICAVADTWDTMVAGRGTLDVNGRREALKVWRERSGTMLDPFLVGNFLLMMSEIGEGPA